MLFHKDKTETWLIQQGVVSVVDMSDASTRKIILSQGGVLHIEPMAPHQVTNMRITI